MEDIELVIKIPEEHYKIIRANKEDAIIAHDTCRRIANGTPLPKRHGRLIDENNLWFEDIDDIACVTQRNVENALTIIEAGKESEDKE